MTMLVTKPSLKKIPQPLATDILQRYEQDRALQKWVDPSLTPVAFINRLAGETMHQELVIFLSHSLLALELPFTTPIDIFLKPDVKGLIRSSGAPICRQFNTSLRTLITLAWLPPCAGS
ncbi:hypothetical protein [Endozoicomonas sp. GU-1]|uniref:hypothetical protein n=1 Tax=Endozoicomonas sp. GU-1 TaxID=3009078 RepID=UPI0022B489B8|nr:hypothetical protein [Endozoicomonas sp. GU-1]WBA86869.1 hypothetical protein O3276_02160 [Endozoicomonas sp. GU-1]